MEKAEKVIWIHHLPFALQIYQTPCCCKYSRMSFWQRVSVLERVNRQWSELSKLVGHSEDEFRVISEDIFSSNPKWKAIGQKFFVLPDEYFPYYKVPLQVFEWLFARCGGAVQELKPQLLVVSGGETLFADHILDMLPNLRHIMLPKHMQTDSAWTAIVRHVPKLRSFAIPSLNDNQQRHRIEIGLNMVLNECHQLEYLLRCLSLEIDTNCDQHLVEAAKRWHNLKALSLFGTMKNEKLPEISKVVESVFMDYVLPVLAEMPRLVSLDINHLELNTEQIVSNTEKVSTYNRACRTLFARMIKIARLQHFSTCADLGVKLTCEALVNCKKKDNAETLRILINAGFADDPEDIGAYKRLKGYFCMTEPRSEVLQRIRVEDLYDCSVPTWSSLLSNTIGEKEARFFNSVQCDLNLQYIDRDFLASNHEVEDLAKKFGSELDIGAIYSQGKPILWIKNAKKVIESRLLRLHQSKQLQLDGKYGEKIFLFLVGDKGGSSTKIAVGIANENAAGEERTLDKIKESSKKYQEEFIKELKPAEKTALNRSCKSITKAPLVKINVNCVVPSPLHIILGLGQDLLNLVQKEAKTLGVEEQLEDRQMTDVFWLIVFITFLAGFIWLGYFSKNVADVSRFFYAMDSFGNKCGVKNPRVFYYYHQVRIGEIPYSGSNVQDKWYSFPLDMSQPSKSAWICVNECPTEQYSKWEQLESHLEHVTEPQSLCFYDFDLASRNISYLDSSNIGPCPIAPVYMSKPSPL
uniref:Uncharacterized protein n=1 Tax=Ditylenchus dipsaci TaxID=166011 RepID=A0A915ETS4_9BILA